MGAMLGPHRTPIRRAIHCALPPATGRALTAALLLAPLVPTDRARAQEALPVAAFEDLRFDEDWSTLAPHTRRIAKDPWLSWKYAPLALTDSSWISIGGELRYRAELREETRFGVTPRGIVNEDAHLVRGRLHADLFVIDGFRVFVEGLFADVEGRDSLFDDRAVDAEDPDLLNAFLESRAPVSDTLWGTLRVGRQQIALGNGRFIGADDWQNAPRRYDGVHALLAAPGFEASAFLVNPVERDLDGFDESSDEESLVGVFMRWYDDAVEVHAHGISVQRDAASIAGEAGEENRTSVGLGATIPFFFGTRASAEGAFQFGEVGDATIRAFMYALELEHEFDLAHGARVSFGVSYASGDDLAGDGRVDTFDQLYPDTHRYHGIADAVGGQNLVDFALRAEVDATANLTVGFAAHRFNRADKNDGVYGALGELAFAPHAGARHVADEVDLYASLRFAPHWTVSAGAALVVAGDFFERVPGSDDTSFVYLAASYRF